MLPSPDGAGKVQRIARLGLEGPDAALAQDDGLVPARHDVLGGQEPLAQLGGKAPLQQDGHARPAQRLQQVVVVHVARAHLQGIHVLGQHLDLLGRRDLGDEGQARLAAHLVHELERAGPKALEAPRVRPHLEDASAEDGSAVRAHAPRHGRQLLASLNGAGAGHQGEAGPAYQGGAYPHRLLGGRFGGRCVRAAREHPTQHGSGSGAGPVDIIGDDTSVGDAEPDGVPANGRRHPRRFARPPHAVGLPATGGRGVFRARLRHARRRGMVAGRRRTRPARILARGVAGPPSRRPARRRGCRGAARTRAGSRRASGRSAIGSARALSARACP